jgi:glycosyltransferase involved in cell wall biosynthesis
MAAGLPVVGWAVGNLPDLAQHGVEGLVVPPGDRGAQAEALKRLAFDEPLHRRKGNAAGRRAEDFPTWGDTARMLFTELRSALA